MSISRFLQATAAVGSIGLFCNPVQATTCDQINQALANPSSGCGASCVASIAALEYSNHPECAPSGNATVGTTAVQATSMYQALTVSDHVTTMMTTLFGTGPARVTSAPLGTGLAGATAGNKSGFWINYNDTRLDYGKTNFNFDSSVTNWIAGYDYRMSDRMVLGVSAAFDDGNVNTKFNNGRVSTGGQTFAPYIGYQINQNWTADASAGLGRGKFDTNVSNGAATATTKSDRQYLAANLGYTKWSGDIQWLGKASLLDASEKKDAYALSGSALQIGARKDSITQLRLGGQVGYWANGWMPYASLTFSNDLSRSESQNGSPTIGKSAWIIGLGVNVFSKGAVYGGLAYTSEQGRSDSRNNVLMANINIRF